MDPVRQKHAHISYLLLYTIVIVSVLVLGVNPVPLQAKHLLSRLYVHSDTHIWIYMF